MDFCEQKNDNYVKKIQNRQFFKVSFFKFLHPGMVLQHENALFHILTLNIFSKKYQSNINVTK